jgi:hypothetical protein
MFTTSNPKPNENPPREKPEDPSAQMEDTPVHEPIDPPRDQPITM